MVGLEFTNGLYFYILEMIKSGIVISQSLLERGRHLSKPPPQFSLSMGDWEGSDKDEMDALSDED